MGTDNVDFSNQPYVLPVETGSDARVTEIRSGPVWTYIRQGNFWQKFKTMSQHPVLEMRAPKMRLGCAKPKYTCGVKFGCVPGEAWRLPIFQLYLGKAVDKELRGRNPYPWSGPVDPPCLAVNYRDRLAFYVMPGFGFIFCLPKFEMLGTSKIEDLTHPTAVAINASGMILIGDAGGTVHVLDYRNASIRFITRVD